MDSVRERGSANTWHPYCYCLTFTHALLLFVPPPAPFHFPLLPLSLSPSLPLSPSFLPWYFTLFEQGSI